MLSLAIIDDEYFLRLGIPEIIDWNAMGITIVGEAANGEDGLALVRSRKPDIILLDIQMPIMNGLAMMEALREESITAKIVVLSGYNDFEYAQIALQNGAVDYLLKPLTRENLVAAMERVKSMITEEKKISQYHARLDQEISSIRQQFLRRLVLGEIANLSEIRAKIEMLKLPIELRNQIAVSIHLDQRFVLEMVYPPEKLQEYRSAYARGLKQCLLESGYFSGFSISIDTGRQCVLLHPTNPQIQPGDVLDAAHACCHRFLLSMEPFSDFHRNQRCLPESS